MSEAFEKVDQLLREATEAQDPPGAVLLVGEGGNIRHLTAQGQASVALAARGKGKETRPAVEASPMKTDTLFDVASITKAIVSVMLMRLQDAGKLSLDDPVSKYFTHYQWGDKAKVTLRHLTSHTAGLRAWQPYYEEARTWANREKRRFDSDPSVRRVIFALAEAEPLLHAPEQIELYSDLGYILLTHCIELVTDSLLDDALEQTVTGPLGIAGAMMFRRLDKEHADKDRSIAATLDCPWRNAVLRGAVHDDNAYVMRGVSAHAGVFATAEALFTLTERVAACWRGEDDFIKQATAQAFLKRQKITEKGSRTVGGWDSPAPQGSMAGTKFGPETVGHLGFTGCSQWMDLQSRRNVILLTNRIHPTLDKEEGIKHLRPAVHDAVHGALG